MSAMTPDPHATQPPQPPHVTVAERPAGTKPSQDRLHVLPNAVVVLDGATSSDPGPRDGGWYAGVLGDVLAARLRAEPAADLAGCLAAAIAEVAAAHDLRPGEAPSSTVTLLRWDAEWVEALVLGDSSVTTFDRDGMVEVVCDVRLDAVAEEFTRSYERRLREGSGFDETHGEIMRALEARLRACRNSPGGYWIAESDPAAAGEALRRRWPVAALDAALVVTDGVSNGVIGYGRPPTWTAALTLARRDGPDVLVGTVHDAELEDPDGRRWPRSKRHDDKTVALVDFSEEGPRG